MSPGAEIKKAWPSQPNLNAPIQQTQNERWGKKPKMTNVNKASLKRALGKTFWCSDSLGWTEWKSTKFLRELWKKSQAWARRNLWLLRFETVFRTTHVRLPVAGGNFEGNLTKCPPQIWSGTHSGTSSS